MVTETLFGCMNSVQTSPIFITGVLPISFPHNCCVLGLVKSELIRFLKKKVGLRLFAGPLSLQIRSNRHYLKRLILIFKRTNPPT